MIVQNFIESAPFECKTGKLTTVDIEDKCEKFEIKEKIDINYDKN
jgi:hypothetical protein